MDECFIGETLTVEISLCSNCTKCHLRQYVVVKVSNEMFIEIYWHLWAWILHLVALEQESVLIQLYKFIVSLRTNFRYEWEEKCDTQCWKIIVYRPSSVGISDNETMCIPGDDNNWFNQNFHFLDFFRARWEIPTNKWVRSNVFWHGWGKYSIFFEQYEKIPDFIAAVGANFTLNVPSCHLHKVKFESKTHEEFFHPPTRTRISTAL